MCRSGGGGGAPKDKVNAYKQAAILLSPPTDQEIIKIRKDDGNGKRALPRALGRA